MRLILQIICTLISAVALSLAIPSEFITFGSPVIAMISLIPLYFVFTQIKTYRQSSLLFALHVFTVHMCSSFWLGDFQEFAIATLFSSAFGTALEGFLTGMFFFLPFSSEKCKNSLNINSSSKAVCSPAFRILWFTIVYTAWEWLKSSGFLAYPWGTVSSAMYNWGIFIQIADITGRYGVTFLTVLFNCVFAEGLNLIYNIEKSEAYRIRVFSYSCTAVVAACLFITSFAYGLYRTHQKRVPVKYLNAIMVQQNADPWKLTGDNDTILTSINLTQSKLDELKNTKKKTDLVIWSEGVLRYGFPSSYAHYRFYPAENPLVPFIQQTQIPFLIGGPVRDDGKYGQASYNSALLFDKDGNYRGYYPKNHLVPFAEVIPFMEYPAFSKFMKKTFGLGSGWQAGDQYVSFDIPGTKAKKLPKEPVKIISLEQTYEEQKEKEEASPFIRVSVPICYDDSFPDIMAPLAKNGTEVFISLTDDSWSKKASSEYQHFVNAAYLPIEYRIPMIRSCNSGYSCVINPLGSVISDMPLFTEYAEYVKVPVYQTQKTVYLLLGNWLPYCCVVFILAILFKSIYNLKVEKTFFSERKFKKSKKSKKSRK